MKLIAALFCATLVLLLAACNNSGHQATVKTDSGKIVYPPYIQNLFDAIHKAPDSNRLRATLALGLDSLGDYNTALKQIDTVVAKDTGNNIYWIKRGNIAEDAGDTLTAMESYVRALRISETPDALLWLAKLYAETKNPRALLIAGRIKDLSQGKEYDAHSAFVAGIYYARTGKAPEALAKFNECIADNYTYMEAYIEKGMVYYDNQQYGNALNVFQFASTVNSLDGDTYYYQGKCYEAMQKKDSAILKYRQALNLDKTIKEAADGLKRLGAG